MPIGSQRWNQRVKSRYDAQKLVDSGSDCESSDSEELPNVNDEELQKYFEIRPPDIFGKEDPARVNLRKSLVQKHFRSLKHFASSTPARAGPGPFNKSSVISPILHQKVLAISPSSKSPREEPKRPSKQRENGRLQDVMQKSSQENARESPLESESSGVRSKSSTQRHDGLKNATRRSAQRRRSFAARVESTSESELPPDVFKRPPRTQRRKSTAHSRISQNLETAELHRSLPDKKRSEAQAECSSEPESESPDVHKKLRNKRRNGSLTHSRALQELEGARHGTHRSFANKKSSVSELAQVLSDCERGDESSSQSESTLKGQDVQRNSRTSQKLESTGPNTHRSLTDKKNSIKQRPVRDEKRDGSSSESEATLKEPNVQKIASQTPEKTRRSFRDKKGEHSRVLPDYERRQDSFSEPETNVKRPDVQKIVTKRTPEKLAKTGSTHRSYADEKRERSQVLPDYERRQDSSSESEATVKRPDVQKIVTKRTPENLEKAGSAHRSFADKKRERSQVLPDYERRQDSSSEPETNVKRPDVQKIVTKRTPEKLKKTGSTHRSFADKKRERSQVLPDYERRQDSSSESEATVERPDVQKIVTKRTPEKLEKTGSTHRSFANKKRESSSESETTMKRPDVQKIVTSDKREKTGSTHRSFADKKRERSQVLPDYERRQDSSSESEATVKRPYVQKIVAKRTPENLEKTESAHRSFADKKRARSQVLPDYERRQNSSSESETTVKRPALEKIVTKITPKNLEKTGSAHGSFADKKRERSQVLPDFERRFERRDESASEPAPVTKEPVVQKKRPNGSLQISVTSQKLGADALEGSIGMDSQFLPGTKRRQDESPLREFDVRKRASNGRLCSKDTRKMEPSTEKNISAKERSIRTIAQVLSDRKRRDESPSESERSDVDERPSRQRPTYRNTSEEQVSDRQRSVPASPQKRRGLTEINDDASVFKQGRAQAREDEPILTKSRARRSRRSVLDDEEPEDVLLSNRRDDARKSTTTTGSNAKDYLTLHSESGRDVQRKAAEKETISDEDGAKNKKKKRQTPLTLQKKKDGGVCDARNDISQSLRDNRMKEIYKNNFYMSSLSDYNTSHRSDSDYSKVGKIHSKVNPLNTPPATESSLSERNDVSAGLNRLNTPHASISASDFIRKAYNIDKVITNIMSSKKESLSSSRPKEVGDAPPSGIEDDAAEVERHRKTARNNSQDKENIEPTQKTTGRRKTATKKKEPPKKRGRKPKVQKGDVVEASDSNLEATGLRRSKRERKQRDLGIPDVFIYVNERNRPIVSKPEKKKKDKDEHNTRKQLKAVSVEARSTRSRKQQDSIEPLPGSSKQTDELRHRLSGGDAGGESQSRYESVGHGGDDFFDDEFSSLGSSEGAQRRKTRHLNMRINNSLYKIEWFNDGKQTLLDMESDTSNTNDTHVKHSIDVPSVATSGYIVIGPSGSKPSQLSRKYSLMFYVIEGTANVTVQNRYYIGGPSCNFFIPFGFEYTIGNLSATKKLTLFCVRIPP